MFKDEKRLFEEVNSGAYETWCSVGHDNGINTMLFFTGVKWDYKNIGGQWVKSLILNSADNRHKLVSWLKVSNVTGIDKIRETKDGAAYLVSCVDGDTNAQLEIITTKQKGE